MGLSRHHILHERSAWTSRQDASNLRNNFSLIPRIDRSVHDELHENCPHVPLLGSYALRSAAGLFMPSGNTLDDMDEICSVFDRVTRHRRAHPIERELAGLAIESIQLQKPFIRAGVANGRIFA